MKITEVKIYPFDTHLWQSKIKAYADVTLDDCLVIRGVKIVEGRQGIFVGFPSRKGKDKIYHDLIVPKNREFHNVFSTAVLKAFRNYT